MGIVDATRVVMKTHSSAYGNHPDDCDPVTSQVIVEYLDEDYTVEDRPLAWQRAGWTESASGYGAKLTSRKVVRLASGKVRRVYITQYSNSGSAWIILGGRRLHLTGA